MGYAFLFSTKRRQAVMNNFESRIEQPWTTYDNRLIQKKTIFKNGNQKLCYLFLVSYANASKIFPSMEAIADAICSTKKTAITIIQQLEELGLIEVIRTPGLSNQYILNDYFKVAEATSEKFTPVKNLHQTGVKITPVLVKNLHPKTKTIKLKTKNKISSSIDHINSIDLALKEKYPIAPFDEIKEQMLNDETLIIETEKQYKSMLEYRLKNWKAKAVKKPRRSTRKEIIPECFSQENNITMNQSEIEEKKASIAEKLAVFRT
jgi:hypothetical protein